MLLLETAPTAGGAAFGEIAVAGAMAGTVMLAVGWEVLRERQGKKTLVGRLADFISELDGLPRWVGLPAYLTTISLLTAGFGVWWDVPIHMQNGRDEGPLANPSHYPIFLGILGFLHAGILSIGLAKGPMPRRTVRLAPSWHAPMGALVIVGAGLIALVGFPADDLWHRLFGQDVTEWGPTHVMMIGGAVTCVLGIPLLLAEARQLGAPSGDTRFPRFRDFSAKLIRPGQTVALALCMIPIAFLMEFDLGVPQFPAATQFIIFGFIAAWICVACRIFHGPGGALIAGGLFLFIHAFLYVTIAVIPDVLPARFLLFLPAAILVELVALLIDPRRRTLLFATVSGLLVGTVGLAGEWWWSTIFMTLPQPFDSDAMVWLIPIGTVAALGGGLLATWHVAMLERVADPNPPAPEATADHRRLQLTGLAGIGIFLALMAAFAPPTNGPEAAATVSFSDVEYADGTVADQCDGGTAECLATVTVKVEPADALDDTVWFYALSWQGRGPGGQDNDGPRDPQADVPGILRVEMKPTGTPGEFRSAHPLPLYGNWKTMMRAHWLPTEMSTLPLHFPDDPAIESARGRQVVTDNGQVVEFQEEKQFLQREQKDDVPTWLSTAGYGLVIGSWIALLLFFGWCYSAAARPPAQAATRERASATR